MTDVVVVGAGIIGLLCAFELRSAGLSVVVVEARAPAAGASGVAAGMLAPLCEAPELPAAALEHAFDGARRWPDLAARLEAASGQRVDLRREGTLLVAADRDEFVTLEHTARLLREHGLRFEPLTIAALRAREPALHPRLAGGFAAPDDHNVDPQAACAAAVTALERAGVPLLTGREVARVEGGAAFDAQGAEIARGATIVLAAGAWSAALCRPWLELPMVPVKGQTILLRGEPLLSAVVRTPRVYLVPRAGGLVVGASMEEKGFDTEPTVGVVQGLLREAWRLLPGVEEHAIVALRAGLRPMLPDGAPRVGPIAPQVVLATGHHRHGVLMAPATAARVTRGIVDGSW